MRVGPRQRFRVDRQGFEAVCRAWWAAEHPGGGEFASLDELTRDGVLAHLKALMKKQQAQTPGDLVALEVFAIQTSESALRAAGARKRRAALQEMATRRLLALLEAARVAGVATMLPGGEFAVGRSDFGVGFAVAEIKAELATREHVPSKPERDAERKRRAAAGKANRARRR